NPTFRVLLGRLRRVILAAFQFQTFPLTRLTEALSKEGKGGASPLFRVFFALNESIEAPAFSGIRSSAFPLTYDAAQFELSLIMELRHGRLRGTFMYNRDLFEPETIGRMVGHLDSLMTGVLQDADLLIDRLPLLKPAERSRLLGHWGKSERTSLAAQSIHALFEAQVQLTPDAIAVESDVGQLTYAELNRQANQLAHCLRQRGVGSETLVGIYMERSIEWIVSSLAILKAGAAYLPLELDIPPPRLALIVEETSPVVILTHSALLAHLPSTSQVLCIDGDATLGQPDEALKSPSNPEALAYVMYTSGSTGKPKGVSIPHRGVVRLVRETNYIQISPHDRFLQASPLAFDAATFEIWGALLNGARLVLPPPGRLALAVLGKIIQENTISVLWMTSGLFSLMVEEQLDALQGIRCLLAGGDVLSVKHVQKVAHQLPHTQLINGYGPTENTTFTCCHQVRRDEDWAGPIPIGEPTSQTDLYILDAWLQPVPMGVAGEIYTGGAGLARGYFNQPALTAEAFVPHPFDNGARLYKTGDRARCRSDGLIEFLGRVDDQVKIRGFRVEPSEIQRLLVGHPAIRDAAVIVDTAVSGAKRLLAYVVATTDEPPSPTALRAYLTTTLPDYMLPEQILLLEQLPLGSRGKVDRRNFPIPEAAQALPETPMALPRNATEATLVELCSEMLSMKNIGIDHNLFDLGGNSLLFMKLKARIDRLFEIDLPLSHFFDSPTIEALALYIVQQKTSQVDSQSLALARLLDEIAQLSDDEARHQLD
ncbi:MAG: amino acid adenylation domain-containing protein, partial [Ardenticatenales bacterium]|nr:amino acid adenylation domain-containing protein [Ardenticatenales bacterium]